MQWSAARKSTAFEANLGTKTEVSHGGRRGPRGALELGDSLTWEFFLGRKINPRRNAETGPSSWDTSVFVPESSRIAALIALGRRLQFSFSRCRLSESRAAEAFPFLFSLLPFLFSRSHLTREADGKSSKTPLPKKHLLEVFGGRPIIKNAIHASAIRPNRA